MFTLTVSLGTATSSSVSIVGNSSGVPVLAGPLVGAGTLTYLVNGPLPAVGYFVNTTTPTGGTVNVSIACADAPPTSVPVGSPLSMALGALALIGFGAFRLRRRYSDERAVS
ncbi:MAG: hypothetical protein EAZ30_10685 [Betaproteobacteria bacterium]|nr:MAG: hypothetical protein EAZ30_10685 [Betaproteobacteria bacterium]